MHYLLRHASLQRMSITASLVTGLPRISKSGVIVINQCGCDICSAYKMKLVSPSKKPQEEFPDSDEDKLSLCYWDQFGRVSVASAGDKFPHAHVFSFPKRNFHWIEGSRTLDAAEVESVVARVKSKLESALRCKMVIIRIDCLSTTRGKQLMQWFEKAMIGPQLTPPGQHQFLGDVERMMYWLLVGALCAMRHAPAPRDMWYPAMVGQVDVENILASRLASAKPQCGWELMLGKKHDVSDLFVFYSPGRFALDRDTLNKWQARHMPDL